jgi:hypothetical protein
MSAPESMVGTASWTDKTLIETSDFYPPDVKSAKDRLRFIASLPERVLDASLAIEFRHRSWTGEEKQRAQTLEFLRRSGLYFVSIDAPEDKSIPPSFMDARAIAPMCDFTATATRGTASTRRPRSVSNVHMANASWPRKSPN